MNEDPIRAAFTRQRRSLMVVSLVLLFTEAVGLTITEVNLFGTKLTVNNPMAINYALWGGYIYWLWRYYVYFHDLGEKGFLSAYRKRVFELVVQIAFRQLQQDRQFIERAQGRKVALGSSNSWSFRSAFRFVVNLSVAFMHPTEQTNAPSEVVPFQGIEVIAPVPLLISHARAWVCVLTRTHLSSEYILPYLVAAAPVTCAVTRALTAA